MTINFTQPRTLEDREMARQGMSTILERSLNKVTAQFVRRADDRVQDAKRALDLARKNREEQLESFWNQFDLVFSPGDRIQWFDGWDLCQGVFTGHSEWHVNATKDNGVSMGLPVVVDTEFEKIT